MNAGRLVFVCGVIFFVSVFVYPRPGAQARAEKPLLDIQVFPKDMTRSALKKEMKKFTKQVGRRCDDCHELPKFEQDTERKTRARAMMRLTQAANARLQKDGFKGSVNCGTCHRGKPTPPIL